MGDRLKPRNRTPDRFFTVEQVAEALGVSSKTVRRRIVSGELPVHRIGRQLRISADDYYAFVALRRAASGGPRCP